MKPTQLFIIFCLGVAIIGLLAVIFTYYLGLEQHKDQTFREIIKEGILKQGLKDSRGGPLVSSDEYKQYLLVQAKDYQIIYQENGDFFIISVNGSPFEKIREEAKKRFLSLAQNSPEIAYQLNANVNSPRGLTPNLPARHFL